MNNEPVVIYHKQAIFEYVAKALIDVSILTASPITNQ